jgi:hypothetical protein
MSNAAKEDKTAAGRRKSAAARRVLPDPVICRGEFIMRPDFVKCLVNWSVHCGYARKLNGDCYCAHKDRMKFAAQGRGGGR